ncbi:DUF4129 domain-containing protein [Marinomonas sp. THO17]
MVYKRDWFLSLTLRRFSLSRSFDMPLTVLEQASDKVRLKRLDVLHPSVYGVATWLTIICLHIEFFIVLGIAGLLIIMIPEQVNIDFISVIIEAGTLIDWVYSLCTFAAMCVVGPFYAVAGFVLYISRRIDLEAWDIEIRFRHLAAEQENKRKLTRDSTSSFLVFICTLGLSLAFFLQAPEVKADEPINIDNQAEMLEMAKAKNDIIDVLLGDDFHQLEQVSGWRLKDLETDYNEDEVPDWFFDFSEFLANNSDFFEKTKDIIQAPSAYIEFILWALAFLLIIYILYRYRQLIKDSETTADENKEPDTVPNVMFGLDVREQSIPENVAAAVHALWIKQEYRDAMSLLYRSTLAGLIHYHQLDFSDSDTEGECLRKVKEKSEDGLDQFFTSLTALWQSLAYGHQLPEESAVRELCEQWDEVLKRE